MCGGWCGGVVVCVVGVVVCVVVVSLPGWRGVVCVWWPAWGCSNECAGCDCVLCVGQM